MRKEFVLLIGLVFALSLVSGIIFAVELPLSVVINDGAEYTNSTAVSLNVSYGNSSSGINITACKFTNVSSSSETFNSKEWAGCPQNNSKTDFTFTGAKHGQILEVWFSIKDLDETKAIWSASDTIILDKVYPLLNISRIEGKEGRADKTAGEAVKLFLNYSDSNSGIESCWLKNQSLIWNNINCPIDKTSMAIDWKINTAADGPAAVEFKVIDKAGNENTTSASIILDTKPPARSNWMPIGTVDPEPVLSFFTNEWAECMHSTASDSEFSEMTSKFDSQNITKTSFYFSKKLNGLEKGPHSYYIKCKDELGNINKDNLIISFNADPQARTSPRILETSPKDKSINIPAEAKIKIKIIFSESVNETSTRKAFNITPFVDGSFEYTGDVLIFVPSALVYRTEYTVTLNENITDLTGVKMGKTYSFSFAIESRCGNNKIDSGEVCDGGFINITNTTNLNCTSYNSSFVGGLLKCGGNCTFDTSSCILPVCGDGKIETYEECEISNMTESCLSKGYDSGKLNCVNCRLDYSSCSKIIKECEAGKTDEGNWGACAGGEQTRTVKECKNKKWVSKTETKDCIEITQGDAQNAINDAQDAIDAAKQQKINTTAAEQKLTEANNALSSGDFENSIKLASDVVGLLEQKGYVKEEMPWFLIGGIILVSAIIIAVAFLVIKGRVGRIENEKEEENKEETKKNEEIKEDELKKEILNDKAEEEAGIEKIDEEELKSQIEDTGADKFENEEPEVEKLEAKKSKEEAITPELMEYIDDEVGRGFSKVEIVKALKEAGYTDEEISVAESVIKKKLKERNE